MMSSSHMSTHPSSPVSDNTYTLLPDGHMFILNRPYSQAESQGVTVLVVISCISATAVIGLLLAIAVSAFNTRKSAPQTLFVRSHVGAYFISLLLCDVAQAVGSIMNARWINQRAVSYGGFCTAQGAFKQLADVGTAWWSMAIAMNTFWILFLQWKLRRCVLVAGMLGGWTAIGAIITAGPAAIQDTNNGPFYAISADALSGYWCWISDPYPSERITLDYMIMFLSALFSFIMYTLVFLKLRGNILVHGWYIKFHSRHSPPNLAPGFIDTHVINIAKGMLLYPVAYTVLLLPIAICRFAEWSGHKVPFVATILSDGIFLLSGFVNVVLFLTTRRVLPMYSVFPRRFCELLGCDTAARARVYTMSSYRTDMEKGSSFSPISLSPEVPLSALLSSAPETYSTRSPISAIGSVQDETFVASTPEGKASLSKMVDSNESRYDGRDQMDFTSSIIMISSPRSPTSVDTALDPRWPPSLGDSSTV